MTITVAYWRETPLVKFAVDKLEKAFKESGEALDIRASADDLNKAEIVILTSGEDALSYCGVTIDSAVQAEGFEIRKRLHHGKWVWFVLALDPKGAMYGTLELAERLLLYKKLSEVPECVVNPRFPFRAVKFNLPWSSYRMNKCFELQKETVRDLAFWRRFLDMMAENRFNVLTLWSLHPFPYMIRPVHFPLATPFSDEELSEWKEYWTSLFRMAKERGIETYLINWNIFVSQNFKKHYDHQAIDDRMYHYGDSYSTEFIKQYHRECITQLIQEYPDLTGLGVSLGERMNDMTPQERQDWVADVYFTAMKSAGRTVKFIHRAPFSVDPLITRTAIESNGFLPEPVWLEVKFNWSHGYSSPRLLLTHGGSEGMEGYWNPPPQHYKITWMVRNEDFFTLRWAQPEYIRKHIAENGHDYVGGYYIGSECFIPAKDYSHAEGSAHIDWNYAFEKHWLYYMLWGRLLYDPSTPDSVFSGAIGRRYGDAAGDRLLKAYSSVCKMPMALASFFSFTWDFTLYAEGFLATDVAEYNSGKAFISLQDLLDSKPSDPSYLSIRAYVDCVLNNRSTEAFITPLQLADSLESEANSAMTLLDSIPDSAVTPALCCEMADVQAWAHLCLYFADKLRAGVCYERYLQTGDEAERRSASQWLKAPHAAKHWEDLIAVTKSHYVEQPLMHLGETLFSWELFRQQVDEDIDFVKKSSQ
jgi:hypothetical protein